MSEQTLSPSMRLYAEWEPVEAVWLAWPHNPETWPGRFDPIPKFFADWARLIAEQVSVRILAAGEVADRAATCLRTDENNIQFFDIPTNDCWIRDYGPSFVQDLKTKNVRAVDWRYNAWGGKYAPWDDDDAAAAEICRQIGIAHQRTKLCLEGGALESDGNGRLLTFRSCLECDRRNLDWDNEQIACELYRLLGVEEIVWLDGGGLEGDDTDGHIDQLARFVDPGNVVAAVCEDKSDSNAAGLLANYRQLELWSDQTTPTVTIHPLPIPPARYVNDTRVPESYCNFLRLGTQRMLVPTFGHAPSDDRALGLFRELCPGTDVVGVDCRDLVWGLGSLHCASLNQPKPSHARP